MVAAILVVTAGMLSPRQQPTPLDDEGRAELRKTLRTLFDANRLMREAKDLPAPARAIVRNAVRSYFKVPPDYQGGNLLKEIMDRLNADLEPLGFVTHWDLGPANNRLRTEFYAFDRNSPQTITLKNGDLTGSVTLYSATFVSGAPYYVYGFALHSKPIVFLMDDFIQSQSSVYRRHMHPKTNLEPLYGEGSSDVVRDILSEAFAGKSDADIAAIYRGEIHDHEILHAWYNLLVQTRKTPDPGPHLTDMGEFASYTGSPAFAQYPYLQLLRHLEFLKTAERLE